MTKESNDGWQAILNPAVQILIFVLLVGGAIGISALIYVAVME